MRGMLEMLFSWDIWSLIDYAKTEEAVDKGGTSSKSMIVEPYLMDLTIKY